MNPQVRESTTPMLNRLILIDVQVPSSRFQVPSSRVFWAVVFWAVVFGSNTVSVAAADEIDLEATRFFREKVEPLLESHCLECHSHATGEMEGGLTLDSRSGWKKGGAHGAAIIPGRPNESLLIKAVRREQADLQMPPEEKLSEEEVEILAQWVKSGAIDPRQLPERAARGEPTDWWSLKPLHKPDVPEFTAGQGSRTPIQGRAGNTSGARNAIDAFVRRRLNEHGLTPAAPADRRTLIRRLYFDLHGLPPTPQTVDEFVNDRDPLAYQKLVDRLLNSPRYGERWARHWLDTVHFADSHGCEHDVFRPNAWRYRDYVVASFNSDTPWDRFVREQLAADWFYPDQSELIPALGFISAGPLELSRAGTAPVTFDYLDRDDIVTQTMAAFASATVNCARCHHHKFDPITQEDYYSLQAVFAGAGKGDLEYDADPAVGRNRTKWKAILDASRSGDSSVVLAAENEPLVAEWLEQHADHSATWEPLSLDVLTSSDGSTLNKLDDGSVFATGERPAKDTYTIRASSSLARVTALRLDVLADDRLPANGPGRCDNGNLHLSEIEVFLLKKAAVDESTKALKIRAATADWNQEGWRISHALDGNVGSAWGIYPKVGQSHYAVFEFEQPVELADASQLIIHLRQLHGGGHVIGRFNLYATSAHASGATILPEPVRLALKTRQQERSLTEKSSIAQFALQQRAEYELKNLPSPAAVYGWSRHFSHGKKLAQPMSPKVVHLLARGDIHKPKHEVGPGAIAAIHSLPSRFELKEMSNEAARRGALAEWLVARENPLTWRSTVNRVWAYHFGRGICDTPNDFGRMGDQPSHPELLDWLAVWFRDDASASVKELHRLILTSATWRQQAITKSSGTADPDGHDPTAIDGENRLLWRMPIRPLDAESYRDAVLQVSGRIDLEMGGPGIQQFTQSPGQQTTPKLDYDAFDWGHPSSARRSVQRVVWRGIADPFMESLDFPDLGLLAPKRGFSVSALQALTVFNNDFVLHHSQVLADELSTAGDGLDAQVRQACRLVLLRDPTQREVQLFSAYAQRHGLAATCRVLFNSNEFVFVE